MPLGSQSVAGGEINTASNLGTGDGVFVSKSGVDLQFKSLKAGTNITLTPSGTEILIAAAAGAGEANTASNLGSGSNVFKAKVGVDLQFRKLNGSGVITVTENANDISVTSSAEANTASNLGAGSGLFVSKVGVDLQFKSLVAGTGVTLTPSGTEILIDTAGEANTASNLGGGEGLFVSKSGVDLQLKSLVAGTNITLTPSGTEILIDAAGGGSGATIALDNLASTAVNDHLLPSSDNVRNLGAAGNRWHLIYGNIMIGNSIGTANDEIIMDSGAQTLPSGGICLGRIYKNASGSTLGIFTNNSNTANSSAVKIETGNAATSGDTGGISLQTGVPDSGTRGGINLNSSRVSLLGGPTRLYNSASDPSSPVAGDVYFNTGTSKAKIYTGAGWETITSL